MSVLKDDEADTVEGRATMITIIPTTTTPTTMPTMAMAAATWCSGACIPVWLAYPTCPGMRLIIKVERTRWPPAGFSCALRPPIALQHRRQRNGPNLADLRKAPRADPGLF